MSATLEQVIEVPATLNAPRRVDVNGRSVMMSLSPFDFPRQARIVLREFQGKDRLTIRLMYEVANDEPSDEEQNHAGLTVRIGRESGRVMGIDISVKRRGLNADMAPQFERVREFLLDLQQKTIKESRRFLVRHNAHYEMLESLLPVVAEEMEKAVSPRLAASGR